MPPLADASTGHPVKIAVMHFMLILSIHSFHVNAIDTPVKLTFIVTIQCLNS